MLFNSINNEYDNGESMTYEIDIQKESPSASLGNNFTKMLKDLDFDMKNNQNLYNVNKALNFEYSFSTNINFNDITSLNFDNETDFINIKHFPTSTPKKALSTNVLNLLNDNGYLKNIYDIRENKNCISFEKNINNQKKDNENWIFNNDNNSISNINIHVNNININNNEITYENDKDTLQIKNLKESVSNIKSNKNPSLSENLKIYTSQLSSSIDGNTTDKVVNNDNKNLQERLIYDTVENFDHFSESEIQIELGNVDILNKKIFIDSNNNKENGDNTNCNNKYNNNNNNNNNNNQIMSLCDEYNILSTNFSTQNAKDISSIKFYNTKGKNLLPDPYDENLIYEENLNKKVRFQSSNEIQQLNEVNTKLLNEKDELEKQLNKMTFEKEKEINENIKSYEYLLYSFKQQEKAKEKKYQDEIDDLRKEILSIKASQSHIATIKNAIENEKDLKILKFKQELTEEKQLQIHNLKKDLLKEKEEISKKFKDELSVKEKNYNNNIKIINNSLKKCKDELDDINYQFNLQKEANHNLKLKLQDQTNEIKNLKNNINNRTIELREYKNELQQKDNIISSLNDNIKKLENKDKQYNELLQKYQNDNTIINNTIKIQQKDIAELNNLIHKQEKEINSLTNISQCQEDDIKKLKTIIQKQKEEISNLNINLKQKKEEIQRYHDQMQEYENQKEDLKSIMKNQKEKQEQINQLESKNVKQIEEYNIIQDQFQKQKQKLEKLNEIYSSQKSEYQSMIEKYNNMKEKNQRMEKTIEDLKLEIEAQKVNPLFNDFNQKFRTYFEKSNPELLSHDNVLNTKLNQDQNTIIVKQYNEAISQIFENLKSILRRIQEEEKSELKKGKPNSKINEKNDNLIPYYIETILNKEGEEDINIQDKKCTKEFIEDRINFIQNFIECIYSIFQKKVFEIDILRKDINVFESLINKKDFNEHIQQKLSLIKKAYQEEIKRNNENYQFEIQAITETMQKEIKSLNQQLKKCQEIMTLGTSVMSTRNHANDTISLTKIGTENYMWMNNFRNGGSSTLGNNKDKLMNSVNSYKSIGSFTTNDDKKDNYYTFEEIIQMYPVESNEWIKRDRYQTEKMVRKQVKNEIVQKINQLQAKFESEKCTLNSYYSMEYNRLATEIKSKCYRAVIRLKSQLELKINHLKHINQSSKFTSFNSSLTTIIPTETKEIKKSKTKTELLESLSLTQQIPLEQQKYNIPSSLSQLYYQEKDLFTKKELKSSYKNPENSGNIKSSNNLNDFVLDDFPIQLNTHSINQTNLSNKAKINSMSSSTTFSLNSSSNPYFAELIKPISSSISPPSSIFTLANKTTNSNGHSTSTTTTDPIQSMKDITNNDTQNSTNNRNKLDHLSSDLTANPNPSLSCNSSATYIHRKPTELEWSKSILPTNEKNNYNITRVEPKVNSTQDFHTSNFNSFITPSLNPSSIPNNNNNSDLKKIYQEYTKRLGQERFEKKLLMKKMEEYNEKIESYKDVIAKVNRENKYTD
ncbi:hypothetical protein BCR36DRAFT_12556, partial [Piromyces finnis]